MVKVKTSELTGAALDWAVQEIEYQRMVAEGEHVKQWALDNHRAGVGINRYSTDWLWGGPILERENISVGYQGHLGVPLDSLWYATNRVDACGFGQKPLTAAMRCFCCSKLGDVVEVPEELTCSPTPKND